MSHGVVVLLILVAVTLVATLANLYDKVERLERRLRLFESDARAAGEPFSEVAPAQARRPGEHDADDIH